MGRFSTTEATATFRARGRKVTPQRAAVFAALERAREHPTAEELHAELREAVPGLALKTVYAILHELASFRLVEPIPLYGSATRWEPNTIPHAHLVCKVCGRLVDLPIDPTVLLPLARRTGRRFHMSRPSMLVQGRCDRCPAN
jgi:Fur family peroxide stress response transcriptional regulator